MDTKQLATDLINRAKNLQEFTVSRDLGGLFPLTGKAIPFSIRHSAGGPVRFTVYAVTQEEAEQQVNNWLDHQDDYYE
jgi:hypothetical protein